MTLNFVRENHRNIPQKITPAGLCIFRTVIQALWNQEAVRLNISTERT